MHLPRLLGVALVLASLFVAEDASGKPPAKAPRKVALIELFVSQGCNMCPAAESLLGELPGMGYGPDRAIPLVFHVDYFNDPWKDPFSDPLFSRREWEYSRIYNEKHKLGKPEYLYFTPMLIVDGTYPQLGSTKDADRTKVKAALDRVLRESPEIDLGLNLDGTTKDPRRKTLTVTVEARTPQASGREVLMGIATFEDGLRTEVAAGELAGKTYNGRYVVRQLQVQVARPTTDKPVTLEVPITLPTDADPARSGVAVFAQNETNGQIEQATSVSWTARSDATAR